MLKSIIKSTIILSIILSHFISCSSVKIKEITLGKEVSLIPNWNISYIPIQIDNESLEKITKLLPSVENLNNSNITFVRDVQDDLIQSYNMPFYSNMIVSGGIEVAIYNNNNISFPDTKYSIHENEVKKDDKHTTTGIQPTILIDKDAPINRIKTKFKVSYVLLSFYNEKKQPIGHIKIHGDDVKPRDISKIISQHITSVPNK